MNLRDFLATHGLGADVQGETIEERHDSTMSEYSGLREKIVHCYGCGQPLMSGGRTPADAERSRQERQIGMCTGCYVKAQEKMKGIYQREWRS